MRNPGIMVIGALAVLFVLTASSAQAEDWEYDLFVYGLGASLDGTTAAGPIEAEVDVGFDDILDNLELGAMTAFRARKNRSAIMVDTIFMGLGASDERVDVDVDQLVVEVDYAYRLSETIEVLLGARFVDIDAEINFLGPLGVSATSGDSWIDPVVGLRFEAPITEKWLAIARFDIGGFGVGSDFSFNGVVSFGREVGKRSTLVFGWRAIDIDYEDGEGLDRFAYDVLSSGPMAGLALHF